MNLFGNNNLSTLFQEGEKIYLAVLIIFFQSTDTIPSIGLTSVLNFLDDELRAIEQEGLITLCPQSEPLNLERAPAEEQKEDKGKEKESETDADPEDKIGQATVYIKEELKKCEHSENVEAIAQMLEGINSRFPTNSIREAARSLLIEEAASQRSTSTNSLSNSTTSSTTQANINTSQIGFVLGNSGTM